jgi:hypothetical protein
MDRNYMSMKYQLTDACGSILTYDVRGNKVRVDYSSITIRPGFMTLTEATRDYEEKLSAGWVVIGVDWEA